MEEADIETIKDAVHFLLSEEYNKLRRYPFNVARLAGKIEETESARGIDVTTNEAQAIIEETIVREVERQAARGQQIRYVEVHEVIPGERRWLWQDTDPVEFKERG
ncbi:hypothetical protein [Mycoplana rhizolycopersici]|uniref:Uncharacterized protein n=1 Tax=Mycoplana rhizolycopersici TaxID=2746702 RepID=A0ABX2QE40_9HYPH|nr:hypothetical protein [Rhizobium rhizolycopersici]NVP55950.1 hypothetical protein [Rhizobium rhizolycopersici]